MMPIKFAGVKHHVQEKSTEYVKQHHTPVTVDGQSTKNTGGQCCNQ